MDMVEYSGEALVCHCSKLSFPHRDPIINLEDV